MTYRLTRITSNHNNLRTPSMIGCSFDPPKVGQVFQIFGAPLGGGDLRAIWTTAITEIDEKSETLLEFKTKNSHYSLEKLSDGDGAFEGLQGGDSVSCGGV